MELRDGKALHERYGYERCALLLQGGGALGAYQAGVYQSLHEHGLEPSWVAGISIGAINAALIAGNPPERRVERLAQFWETISHGWTPPMIGWVPSLGTLWGGDLTGSGLTSLASATRAVVSGQEGFFTPRVPPPWLLPSGAAGATSFYDTTPLRATLERLVDFDRINAGEMRFAVGAVNVESGNFRYFDSAREAIRVEHILASGALPPAFAPVEVPGEGWYWDGGLVSNTPLEYVLDDEPRADTLAFQVDLWSARGRLPRDLLDVLERQKDIQFSSRTRKGTDNFARGQGLRRLVAVGLARLAKQVSNDPAFRALAAHACNKVVNIVHLIYESKIDETHAKDYEFSAATMRRHWTAGVEDATKSIEMPHVFERPRDRAVVTHDIHHLHRARTQATSVTDRAGETS
jgi:NTE family protein